MTRESSRTTGERCSFFSRKSGVFAVAVAYRKSGLWTYGRQSGRTWIAEAPVVRTFRVCAKKCDISASRVLSKHTSKLTRLCEKTLGWNDIVFVYSFSHNLRAKRIRSITFMSISGYFPISHGGRHSKWKVEELLDAWDARRVREGVRMKGVLLLLHVPFRTPATQAVFQLERVSIKESSHFCKVL